MFVILGSGMSGNDGAVARPAGLIRTNEKGKAMTVETEHLMLESLKKFRPTFLALNSTWLI